MWWIYVIISVITFAVLTVLQRVISVNSKNHLVGSFAFNLTCAVLATGMYLVQTNGKPIVWPLDKSAYFFWVIAAVSYGIYEKLRLLAASKIEASESAVLSNITLIIAFAGSIWLYSENPTPIKALGAALIIAAAILVSWQPNVHLFRKEAVPTIIANSILGIGNMLDKKGTENFQPELYSLLNWTIPLLVIFFPYIKPADIINEFKIASWRIPLLAIINVTGYFSLLKAFSLAQATIVLPLIQTSSLLAIFLGILFLREKDRLGMKLASGVLALAGVFLLTGN